MRKLASVRRSVDSPVEAATDAAPVHLGRIATLDESGNITVATPQSVRPVAARLAIKATRKQISRAIETRQQVVMVFENNDPRRPIVIGFIEAPAADEPPTDEIKPNQANSDQARVIEADVDGKRIKIAGKDEIVLECGQATITLRRNGRIVIRGTHVETCSEGTNRIKGGQVRIN